MCLINLAWRVHTDLPFLLVANRDEFYNRPTAALHWWEDDPHILAGRDLKDGGTWMGMSKEGRFAAITNYRDLRNIKENVPSRGIIPVHFLNKTYSLEQMHRFLQSVGNRFNGFNLLYGDRDSMFHYANVTNVITTLTPGTYGLSNALLNTPWPKLTRSMEQFQTLVAQNGAEADFIEYMLDRTLAADDALPQTGVPFALEKQLSAMFIKTPEYGTRLTTFVSVDSSGNVVYHEKSYVPEHEKRFTFTLGD
ncbi:MAG: NRDE family protein [Chitinophagales bacterium]